MSFLKKLVSSTVGTVAIQQFAAAGDIFHAKTEARSLCDTFTQPLLKTDRETTSGWIKKALLFGGSVIVCSYAGYKLWQYLAKNEKNDKDKDKSGGLPDGTLWCDLAGDEWARGDVPYDPVYGLPPCLQKEGGDGDLTPDLQYSIPAGASWADICPKEVEEVEFEAAYKLPSEEEEGVVLKTVWGMDVIWEEEDGEE